MRESVAYEKEVDREYNDAEGYRCTPHHRGGRHDVHVRPHSDRASGRSDERPKQPARNQPPARRAGTVTDAVLLGRSLGEGVSRAADDPVAAYLALHEQGRIIIRASGPPMAVALEMADTGDSGAVPFGVLEPVTDVLTKSQIAAFDAFHSRQSVPR